MIDNLQSTMNQYMRFYYHFTVDSWNGMTPTGYASLLTTIGVVGWLLMKSNMKL